MKRIVAFLVMALLLVPIGVCNLILLIGLLADRGADILRRFQFAIIAWAEKE